jgi:hypothetical protein
LFLPFGPSQKRFILFSPQKFLHDRPRIGSLVPEAAMIILVGMMAGYILHFVVHHDATAADAADADAVGQNYEDVAESIFSFSPTIFFIILLPPIIFNSGYHLQRDLFFRYITPICLYACIGTAICTMVVASILYALSFVFVVSDYFAPTFLELLAFGALISATDVSDDGIVMIFFSLKQPTKAKSHIPYYHTRSPCRRWQSFPPNRLIHNYFISSLENPSLTMRLVWYSLTRWRIWLNLTIQLAANKMAVTLLT